MFRCPHCQQPGISPLRKVVLSPGLHANCNTCNRSSGIRYPLWLAAMLPGTGLMIAALFVDSATLEWALNITGFLLMVVMPFLFTPLCKVDE